MNQTFTLQPAPQIRKERRSNKFWVFLAGLILLLGFLFLWNRQAQTQKAPQAGSAKNKPVPVVVSMVQEQSMPVEVKTIGNVESLASVTLKPQADGQITGIHFKEGDIVRQGALLFSIDPQSVQAAIAQARAIVSKDQALVAQARSQRVKDEAQVRQVRATLKKDQAQLKFAEAQEKRYAALLAQQFISQSEYEQVLSTSQSARETVAMDRAAIQNAQASLSADEASIESAQANVMADQALLESNQIKLSYTLVRAPISGRTGSLKVHLGDTVKNNETLLVALDQINPINVGFSIPEQSLPELRAAMKSQAKTVTVRTQEKSPQTLSGQLIFVENTVDTTTGTIRAKARFNNQNQLWPGQYVDVTLQLAQEPHARVIPSQAVQSGQKGDYVFVVRQNRALLQPVVVSRMVNDLAVIQSGLKPNDAVVTDGQSQLVPNAPVHVSGSDSGARTP